MIPRSNGNTCAENRRSEGTEVDFGDRTLPDSEGPHLRGLALQRDDQVVPVGVRGRGHVGGAGVGLGVGMTVHDPPDLEPLVLGRALGTQMVAWVDGVDAGRLIHVATGEEPHDLVRARRAGHQPTGFQRVLAHGQLGHRGAHVGGDEERFGRSPARLVRHTVHGRQGNGATVAP